MIEASLKTTGFGGPGPVVSHPLTAPEANMQNAHSSELRKKHNKSVIDTDFLRIVAYNLVFLFCTVYNRPG